MVRTPTLRAVREERVAVLLNAQARSVTDAVRTDLARFVPPEDLYYSRTFREAQSIARDVLDKSYDTVLTGGGDGTFCGFANPILDLVSEAASQARVAGGTVARGTSRLSAPRFGALRLGTGNALASFCGASSRRTGVIEDILRTCAGDTPRTIDLHLVEVDGKRAPFAGLGFDAQVLNDYMRVKGALKLSALKKLAATPAGYVWSGIMHTAPRMLLKRDAEVEIVNEGAPAMQIGPDGRDLGRPIGTGEILFRGKVSIAAAGTVPCYGFGYQIFPHALKSPGRFQLRLSAMGVFSAVRHIPTVWRGQTPEGVLDFHCERVRMRFSRPMPLQVGGDAEGYRDEVVIGMAREAARLVDFRRV